MNPMIDLPKADANKHFDSIDYMKGIGIFLVVLGHVILLSNTENSIYLSITRVIYSFHMPLFFIISGMGLGLKFQQVSLASYKLFLLKTFKALMIPYWICSIIYTLLSCIANRDTFKEVLIERMAAMITGRGIAPIWFLISLFLAENVCLLVLILINKFITNRFAAGLVCCTLSAVLSGAAWICLPLLNTGSVWKEYVIIGVCRFFPSLFFVSVGYLETCCFARLLKQGGQPFIPLCIATVICFGITFGASERNGFIVNMHTFSFDNIFLFLIVGVIGSVGIQTLCLMLPERILPLKILGKTSKHIMMIHYPPIPMIKLISLGLTLLGIEELYLMKSLIVTAMCVAVILVCHFVKERIKNDKNRMFEK